MRETANHTLPTVSRHPLGGDAKLVPRERREVSWGRKNAHRGEAVYGKL